MTKPISTKKMIMFMLSLAATIVIFFAMSLSASAAAYPSVKLDVPRISQTPGRGDCAIASMATVEAYCHDLPSGDYNSKAYQAVYSANGYSISAMWSKLGFKTIEGFSMTTAYNQLKTGYPIIVHRSSQHYSVIYGYTGSSSYLELSGFLVVDVDDSYNSKTAYFTLDKWRRSGSLDRMVIRQDGLAVSTNKLKITTNHPAKEAAKGESFTPYGKIVSDCNITSVSVSVNNAAGAQKQYYSAKPNATSFNLSKAISSIKISELPTGTYTYWITAKDSSGDVQSYKYTFTIGNYKAPSINITEVSYKAIVKASPSLNLRTGAGLEYDVITSIPQNEIISVSAECNGWAKVSYSGKVGWVSMEYIEKYAEKPDINQSPSTPSVPDTFASYYARLKSNGELKEKANVFAATVASVPAKTVVKVIGESDGWIKFAYKGVVGWMRKNAFVTSLGDLNGSGTVNSADALIILSATTGAYSLNDSQKTAADFNGDGSVNSIDALTVLQVSAGAYKFD